MFRKRAKEEISKIRKDRLKKIALDNEYQKESENMTYDDDFYELVSCKVRGASSEFKKF